MRAPSYPPRGAHPRNDAPITGYRYAHLIGERNDHVDYCTSAEVFETEEKAAAAAVRMGGWYGVYFDDSHTGPFIMDWKHAEDSRMRLWVAHTPLAANNYLTLVAGTFADLGKVQIEIDAVGGRAFANGSHSPGECICSFRNHANWIMFAERIRKHYGIGIQVGLP